MNIDPEDLDFVNGSRVSGVGDRDYSSYLGKIKGTDLWINYNRALTGMNPTEHAINVHSVGTLNVEPGGLNTHEIARQIEEHAWELSEKKATDGYDIRLPKDRITAVSDNADAIAENMVEHWTAGARNALGDAIYQHEGVSMRKIYQHEGISMRKDLVWLGHVPDAFHYEVKWALKDEAGFDDARYHKEDPLYDGIRDILRSHASKRDCRNCEYWGRIDLESEKWERRFVELLANSNLPTEIARVVALNELDHTTSEIAETLDKSPSAVSHQLSRAQEIVNESSWTANNVSI